MNQDIQEGPEQRLVYEQKAMEFQEKIQALCKEYQMEFRIAVYPMQEQVTVKTDEVQS